MSKKKGSKFRLKSGQDIILDPKNDVQILGAWEEDMIWCPSQCYLSVKHVLQEYQIYLRWRHDDPWTCSLIKKQAAPLRDIWSDDLFGKYGKFWKDSDSLKQIEASALDCVREYLTTEGFRSDLD